jgi:hypothetical protein
MTSCVLITICRFEFTVGHLEYVDGLSLTLCEEFRRSMMRLRPNDPKSTTYRTFYRRWFDEIRRFLMRFLKNNPESTTFCQRCVGEKIRKNFSVWTKKRCRSVKLIGILYADELVEMCRDPHGQSLKTFCLTSQTMDSSWICTRSSTTGTSTQGKIHKHFI